MNIQQINDKYPKAFAAWLKWLGAGGLQWIDGADNNRVVTNNAVIRIGEDYSIRNFYDFFDKENIILGVMGFIETGLFDMDIEYIGGEGEKKIKELIGYKTRKEAETEGFTKAFELLDQKLTNDSP